MMLPDIDTFYNKLGERIKTERLKKKISQEQLGEHLSLTRTSVINLEKGRHKPSIYQLILIANFFDILFTVLIPVNLEKQKVKSTKLTKDFENVVTDQDKIDKSSRVAIHNFLTSLESNDI